MRVSSAYDLTHELRALGGERAVVIGWLLYGRGQVDGHAAGLQAGRDGLREDELDLVVRHTVADLLAGADVRAFLEAVRTADSRWRLVFEEGEKLAHASNLVLTGLRYPGDDEHSRRLREVAAHHHDRIWAGWPGGVPV